MTITTPELAMRAAWVGCDRRNDSFCRSLFRRTFSFRCNTFSKTLSLSCNAIGMWRNFDDQKTWMTTFTDSTGLTGCFVIRRTRNTPARWGRATLFQNRKPQICADEIAVVKTMASQWRSVFHLWPIQSQCCSLSFAFWANWVPSQLRLVRSSGRTRFLA